MSGRVGSITTDIIADGLVFNMDAANRASYPAQRTFAISESGSCYNTLDLSQSGSFISDPQFITQPISASCWAFDGVDDYIEITTTTAYTTTSLSMWVKTSKVFDVNVRDSLASNNNHNQGRDFVIADSPTTTNDAYISMFAGALIYGKTSASGGIPVNDGNWHHLVWTYDSTAGTSAAINMYVDGANQYSESANASYWTREIKYQYFGKPIQASAYFDGDIGLFHIYNRALSSTEVLHNYNALKGRFV